MSWTSLPTRCVLSAAALTALASCAFDKPQQLEPEATARSGAEAAQVNVDIVSINHWQDVQNRFSSGYAVTGKSALGLVSQAAAFENASLLRSSSFGAGIEFDGNIISNDSSRSSQSTTTGGTTTTTAANSSSSDIKQATPTAAAPPAAGSSPVANVPAFAASQVPTLAPGLALQAADGYFRAANVLDIGYGSIAPCGYTPVLMTFRITIVPQKHNLPYDTYVDISLAPKYEPNRPRTQAGQVSLANLAVNSDPGVLASKPLDRVQTLTTAAKYFLNAKVPEVKLLPPIGSDDESGSKDASAPAPAPPPPPPVQSAASAAEAAAATAAEAASATAAAAALESDPQHCGHPIDSSSVRIVSFSSDSLENTQSDITAQQTKALLLGAAIRAGRIGGSADFQKVSQQIDSVLSLRPNSLLSVSQHGPGTLHVRLGANRFGTNQYEMLPLEHNVSILLLVPTQLLGRQINAVGHYYFVNVHSVPAPKPNDKDPDIATVEGVLPTVDKEWSNRRMNYMLASDQEVRDEYGNGIWPILGGDDLKSLALYVRRNDFGHFLSTLATRISLTDRAATAAAASASSSMEAAKSGAKATTAPKPTAPRTEQDVLTPKVVSAAWMLWARLLRVAWVPGMTETTAEVPVSLHICPVQAGQVVVKDDGTSATAQVRGGDGWANQHVTATLWFKLKTQAEPVVRLAAVDLAGPDVGDLVFQSVSDLVKPGDYSDSGLYFRARDKSTCPANQDPAKISAGYPVTLVVAPKDDKKQGKDPIPTGLSAFPSQVTESGTGTGSFPITIALADVKADSVVVSAASGGQLVKITSTTAGAAPVLPSGGKVTLASAGDYSVDLANLAPGKPISLTFTFQSGKKKVGAQTIKLPILKS